MHFIKSRDVIVYIMRTNLQAFVLHVKPGFRTHIRLYQHVNHQFFTSSSI